MCLWSQNQSWRIRDREREGNIATRRVLVNYNLKHQDQTLESIEEFEPKPTTKSDKLRQQSLFMSQPIMTMQAQHKSHQYTKVPSRQAASSTDSLKWGKQKREKRWVKSFLRAKLYKSNAIGWISFLKLPWREDTNKEATPIGINTDRKEIGNVQWRQKHRSQLKRQTGYYRQKTHPAGKHL